MSSSIIDDLAIDGGLAKQKFESKALLHSGLGIIHLELTPSSYI